LTSALDGGEWSSSHPGRFTPGERDPGIRWIGGWVDPRAGLNAVVKRRNLCPCLESNPGHPTLVTLYLVKHRNNFASFTYIYIVINRQNKVNGNVYSRNFLSKLAISLFLFSLFI
jgi:hypothetical protein